MQELERYGRGDAGRGFEGAEAVHQTGGCAKPADVDIGDATLGADADDLR
jgi:hypothetical protein